MYLVLALWRGTGLAELCEQLLPCGINPSSRIRGVERSQVLIERGVTREG
jgi:hypothetical protein